MTQQAVSSRQPTRRPMRSSNGCFGLRIQPIDSRDLVIVHPQDTPLVRSERTSLSPRGTRAAGPWGRPWPPPECAPRGHSGQRRARVDPPRAAPRGFPGFQVSSSPGRRPHRVASSRATDPISDSPMVGRFPAPRPPIVRR